MLIGKRLPATQTSRTLLFFAKGSPSRTTRCASMPGATRPRRSSIPSRAAGVVVRARSASSGSSPRSMVVRTAAGKLERFSRPSLVRAIVTPASTSLRAFVGASSQAIRSRRLWPAAFSGVDTSGASGYETGMTIGSPRLATAPRRRNSVPVPFTIIERPSSAASLPARNVWSSLRLTKNSGATEPESAIAWSAAFG